MSRKWIDVMITTDLDPGEIISRLDDPFVQGAWHDGAIVHFYWADDQWKGDQLIRLRATLSQLGDTMAFSTMTVEEVGDRDWNRHWAESVTPVRVGRRIVIRPSWEFVVVQGNELEIILDPKQAFGTGHHATTQLMLEWLEELIRGGESVLDVGTGSGILAMAALKLGAAGAIGIDHDPVALDCAKENARLNSCGSALRLSSQPLADLSGQRFDLIFANLDRRTLLDMAGSLAFHCRSGGRLLLSGVLVDQEEEIVRHYADEGLYCSRRRDRDNWLVIELCAMESCEDSST